MAVTKTLFCAACQADTQQAFHVHTNDHKHQELISTCACGRELKWPVDATDDELRALFSAHKECNTGHVFVNEDGSEIHPVLDRLANL